MRGVPLLPAVVRTGLVISILVDSPSAPLLLCWPPVVYTGLVISIFELLRLPAAQTSHCFMHCEFYPVTPELKGVADLDTEVNSH